MTITRTLTATAFVLTLVLGSSGAAMAAWVVKDTVVKKNPGHMGVLGVNHVSKGEEVTIISEKGKWYKIQIPGPDGWVGKSAITFEKPGKGWGKGKGWGWGHGHGWGKGAWGYGYGSGGSFCVESKAASICIGAGY